MYLRVVMAGEYQAVWDQLVPDERAKLEACLKEALAVKDASAEGLKKKSKKIRRGKARKLALQNYRSTRLREREIECGCAYFC